MGLFTENSARLATVPDVSFGNALKAYRQGSGDSGSLAAISSQAQSKSDAAAATTAAAAKEQGKIDPATGIASFLPATLATSQTVSAHDGVDSTSANRFLDLVKQAVNQPTLTTPQRISVDLQTPPGETVTVFFSQTGSNGQVRAQLSASDATSLQWLQQQVGSLREGTSGTTGTNGPNVVWLPPQLDNSRSGRDPQQDTPRRDSNSKGGRSSGTRSAEDVAMADAIFGSNGTLSSALSR